MFVHKERYWLFGIKPIYKWCLYCYMRSFETPKSAFSDRNCNPRIHTHTPITPLPGADINLLALSPEGSLLRYVKASPSSLRSRYKWYITPLAEQSGSSLHATFPARDVHPDRPFAVSFLANPGWQTPSMWAFSRATMLCSPS